MNALDRVREKFKSPRLHPDKTDRRAFVGSVRGQDKRFEISQNEIQTPTIIRRPIVEYRFADDPPELWHTLLGLAGESFAEAEAALRRQFPDVAGVRERDELPANFPFRRHGDDGEYKRVDGTEL